MAKTIALANQKGGCAKTTSAVNLAACLGELGDSVLVIDLDPQGSASLHLGVENDGMALLGHLEHPADLAPLVVRSVAPGVDVVPSGLGLASADLRLMGKMAWEKRLLRCLKKTEETWDWIFFDCPPGLGFLTANALVAADGVLIPVQSTALSIAGLRDLMDTIETVREEDNPNLRIVGILPCQAHKRRILHRQALKALAEDFPEKLAPVVIRENVSVAEAAGHQQPVILYAPKSNGAEDYRASAQWIRNGVQ